MGGAAEESNQGASLAELAAEAERVAEGSDSARDADQSLQPPGWVADGPPPEAPAAGEVQAQPDTSAATERKAQRGLVARRSVATEAPNEADAETADDDVQREPKSEPEPEAEAASPEPEPEPEAVEGPEGTISLSGVTFDELRELGLSVTQSKRVLKYRDERGFSSVDQLDQVPGFPRSFLAELKDRMVP
jgi:DNA uptake protein ComE-like DNA-binding protein